MSCTLQSSSVSDCGYGIQSPHVLWEFHWRTVASPGLPDWFPQSSSPNKLWFSLLQCKDEESNKQPWYHFVQTQLGDLPVCSVLTFIDGDGGTFFLSIPPFWNCLREPQSSPALKSCCYSSAKHKGGQSFLVRFLLRTQSRDPFTQHFTSTQGRNTHTELSAKIYFLVEVQCHRWAWHWD